jgi:manganese oxidase
MSNRRAFFRKLSSYAGAAFAGTTILAAQEKTNPAPVAVTTPDVPDLPFTVDNGVKVFHLVAEPVKQVIVPGRTFDLWGFNGSAPGPTIQATEGDRVRIIFDNHLPEPTGIHWHGLELPIEMDGVPGVGQRPIPPGGQFVYEFTLHQNGTFFYHPHVAMQEIVGMLGGFIIHPKIAHPPAVDKDYVIALQEYAVLPNNTIPSSMSMEYNWLTFNGKAGPAADRPFYCRIHAGNPPVGFEPTTLRLTANSRMTR